MKNLIGEIQPDIHQAAFALNVNVFIKDTENENTHIKIENALGSIHILIDKTNFFTLYDNRPGDDF